MTTLYVDIETFSRIDLKKSNAYRYTEDPSFLMLMAGWALDDDPVQVVFDPHDIYNIPGLWDPKVEKVAHNAAFERISFSAILRDIEPMMERFEYLSPEDWTDTQALAGEHGYPQKLEQLARALGGEQKDSAGTALINFFCKPDRSGKRRLPEDHPEKWAQFVEYCRQDVVTLRDVHRKLPTWPTEAERRAYMADQRINDLGIAVDVDMVKNAIETAESNRIRQSAEITELTGVENPNSGPQMTAWLKSSGLEVPNLQAETIKTMLAGELNPVQRRVLELRQELALVAAKKYQAALDRVNGDGRLRGSFHFFGAHTGRWAGRGVQLQNLPSATIKPGAGEDVDTAISAAVLDLALGFGTDAHTLKALVRAMFIGPFTVVDYSAIEARVVAWLAGEQWALDAFAAGRDIYVETAERMGGLTRKEGKVAVLALGYNGGTNSLRAMGADGEEHKLKRLVYQWRDANENIVALWQDLENAFLRGDEWAGKLYVEKDEHDRRIVLPSGRAITYHNVRMNWKTDQYGRQKKHITFDDPKQHGWRGDTYGGRLTENVTQAVARDVLSEALVRLQERGHEVVGHVHDEILVEGFSSVEEVTKIMVESPTWADGLPLNAEGFMCPRYRKD